MLFRSFALMSVAAIGMIDRKLEGSIDGEVVVVAKNVPAGILPVRVTVMMLRSYRVLSSLRLWERRAS